jgi:hypothetical protein
MTGTSLHELIPVLQVAVGPVILISGVGLLLLSLTNRFGRAADRSRQLAREMRVADGEERRRLAAQVENLYQRAVLIQTAIVFATISLLLVALLIIVLFIAALMKLEAGFFISVLFICCMVTLIASLTTFIKDINLSLTALKLELGHAENGGSEKANEK